MKLYANLKDTLRHPIKYIVWRIRAEKVWAQSLKSQYVTFNWFLKHGD